MRASRLNESFEFWQPGAKGAIGLSATSPSKRQRVHFGLKFTSRFRGATIPGGSEVIYKGIAHTLGKFLFVILLLVLMLPANAQQKKPVQKKTVQKNVPAQKKQTPPADKPVDASVSQEERVRDIVKFLEYLMNTLASEETPARDKDVIVTESYLKIFRDSKVQVEDDLDAKREVITNKDATAYLKDVDFFFKNAKFEFKINKIEQSGNPEGTLYYKVSMTRDLSGITSEGKNMTNSMPRFIEVNYDPKHQDLKIVSIYTNQFDETVALKNWWQGLSLEWQQVFRSKINKPTDSIQISDIKQITALTELDASNNTFIRSIDPLSQFSKLNILRLSGLAISDLSPLRNMTELEDLSISKTNVSDISVMKYFSKLKKLDISNTLISDISVLEKLTTLQSLKLSYTQVSDLNALNSLTELTDLSMASTKATDLSPLASLSKLTELNAINSPVTDVSALSGLNAITVLHLDSTRISSIAGLTKLSNLKLLYINHTTVGDLTPLQTLPRLEKIYCDQTLIKRPQAEAFMTGNPKVLVIFDSKDLLNWWSGISDDWKKFFSKTANISMTPSKEELAQISKIDSVNVSGQNVTDISPVLKLPKLKVVVARNTGITDLLPLTGLKEITSIDISETSVKSLSPLERLPKLKVIIASKSKVEGVEFQSFTSLQKLYVDGTTVNDVIAARFLEKNSKCLIIYKSVLLKEWWTTLPPGWRDIFSNQDGMSENPSMEQLHRLVEQTKLTGKDAPVSSLSMLSEFIRLKELSLSGTALTTITPVESIRLLKSLHIAGSPLTTIEGINFFIDLEDLDISNTPIIDIYPVWQLNSLKRLNCAGTQIKRIDALEKLESLEFFDCSNTNVNKLDALSYLKLKTLKCFNTRVSNKAIENFKASHPECSVMYYR